MKVFIVGGVITTEMITLVPMLTLNETSLLNGYVCYERALLASERQLVATRPNSKSLVII